MISYDDIIWWYHMMISYNDIIWWYHSRISYDDIIWWFHIMISYDDIMWRYHIFLIFALSVHYSCYYLFFLMIFAEILTIFLDIFMIFAVFLFIFARCVCNFRARFLISLDFFNYSCWTLGYFLCQFRDIFCWMLPATCYLRIASTQWTSFTCGVFW